jgi:hypothetical protein
MHSQAIMSMVMNIAITICVEILTANDVIVFSGSRHVDSLPSAGYIPLSVVGSLAHAYKIVDFGKSERI